MDSNSPKFTGLSVVKRGIAFNLINSDMAEFTKTLDEVSEDGNPDVVLFKIFPGLNIGASDNREFIKDVLNNPDKFGKPDATEVLETLGAPGVLSITPTRPEDPLRAAARGAIGGQFTQNLNKPEFALDLRDRIHGLLDQLENNPEQLPYDEIMKKLRLEYLRNIFFSDELTTSQMQDFYSYVESVFGMLLSQSLKAPWKNFRGITWHDMTPKSMQEMQSQAEKIIFDLIEERKKSKDGYGDDILGNLMGKMSESQKEGDLNYAVLSGIAQVLFASLDTTASAVGSMLKALANNPEQQDRLRKLAIEIQTLLGGKPLSFANIQDRKFTQLYEFHRFVGNVLANTPPTPNTARKALVDVEVDGITIRAGTNIFLVLGPAQIEENNERDKMNGETTYSDLTDFIVFGHGPTKCVGRPFAIYEMLITVIEMLANTSRIELIDPGEMVMGSTFSNQGMIFNFVRKEKDVGPEAEL